MAVEFWCVHALDLCHSCLVAAFVLDSYRILEDIDALGQIVDEKVAGGFVVVQAVLVFVFGRTTDLNERES